MGALSIQSEKSALRRLFRQARQTYMAEAGHEAVLGLTDNLRRLTADVAGLGAQICLYQALPEEPSIALEPASNYFFPRIVGEELEFWRPRHADGFELNSFKIPEPITHSSDRLDPRRPLVVCCPAVAVDWQGNRMGLGKGFYDRFFASHPKAIRIGVVFQIQVSKVPLPADSWDQALDWIVTEKMILRTSNRSL